MNTRSNKQQTLSGESPMPWVPSPMFTEDQIALLKQKSNQSPHSGISTLKYFTKLKSNFLSRKVNAFMKVEDMKKEVFFEGTNGKSTPKHPYLRTMVSVESDAFKEAVRLITYCVMKAKDEHVSVCHADCCNIIWIGKPPRVTTHNFNEKVRKYLDLRNVPNFYYKPDYLPQNSENPLKRKKNSILEHLKAEREQEEALREAADAKTDSLSMAATRGSDSDDEICRIDLASQVKSIWDDIDDDGNEISLG